MRVSNKPLIFKIYIFLTFSTLIVSMLFSTTTALAFTKPSGVGSWYTSDPAFSEGGQSLVVGSKTFSPHLCPSGPGTDEICQICNEENYGQCRFDYPNVKMTMFVSGEYLPDSSGNSVKWGILVTYNDDDTVTKNAYLYKIDVAGGLAEEISSSIPLSNTGSAPPPPTNQQSLEARFFSEPYISGTFVNEEGKVVPGVSYTIYKMEDQWRQGDKIKSVPASVVGQTLDINSTIAGWNLNGPGETTDSGPDGDFMTVSGSSGLPDGTYRIVVDQLTDKEFFDQLGEKALFALFPAIVGGLKAVGCISDIPSCYVEALSKTEMRIRGSQDVVIANGQSQKDVKVELRVEAVSALDNALSGAIKTLSGFVGSFMRFSVGTINTLLEGTADVVLGDGVTTGVESAWTKIRNIALTLLIMALVIIAFANVLQIDIEHYGLNRMIPRIIISIIMAYLSWIIVTFFFDFTLALQNQAEGLLSGGSGLDALGSIAINTPTGGDILSKAGAVLVLLVLLIGILICLIILMFTLLMRVVVLSFLLAVAPLAFILNIMPFTSNLYKQWWSEFFKWMFMGPIAVTIIALGSVIASGSFGFTGGNMTLSGDSTTPSGSGWNMLIGLLILGASIYFAATLPQKWGGNIMKGWQKAGKGFGKWAGNTAGVSGARDLIGNRLKTGSSNQSALRANKLASLTTGGMVGTSTDVLKRQQFDAAVTEAGKQIGVTSADQPTLISRFKTAKSNYERSAIMREMASRGDFEKLYAADGSIDMNTGAWVADSDDAQHDARALAGTNLMKFMGKDQVLDKAVSDNQGELIVAARNSLINDASPVGDYSRAKYGALIAGQRNKSLKEKRMNILDEIDPSEISKFMTEFDMSKMNDSQASSAKAQAKYKSYKEREAVYQQQQSATEYSNDPSVRASVHREAEAENITRNQTEQSNSAPGYHGVGEDD